MFRFIGVSLALVFCSVSSFAMIETAGESFYPSNLKMREERKVGLGVVAGGTGAAIGLQVELNVEDQDGAVVSFGVADSYSTFSLAWKHSFEGLYLTPYTTLGWSRWYNSSGSGRPNSYVLSEVLSDEELASGRFGADFIVGAFGAQYNQLDGDLLGASFFAQMELLASPFQGRIVPSAGLGMIYYF